MNTVEELKSELSKGIERLGNEFGYPAEIIHYPWLFRVARDPSIGWQYESEELRESVTEVDLQTLMIKRPPAQLNERTLGGVLKYQVGYDYKGSVPEFPVSGTNELVALNVLLGEIGQILMRLLELSPDESYTDYLSSSKTRD